MYPGWKKFTLAVGCLPCCRVLCILVPSEGGWLCMQSIWYPEYHPCCCVQGDWMWLVAGKWPPFLFAASSSSFFNKNIYWLCYYSCPISPLHSTPSCPPPPSHIPPYSSCPWVILISSLASTFPILFLNSLCLFSTYHLFYLFSVPFPPSLPLPLPCW